ncbi:MAG: GGDEF domain-containing protein [Azovibrio sp.]|uniref:GGDEF domain-containing protein n=1 Tax=Azovibrio sp. TaxID=1872673 RepID=UPI003C76F5B7
MTPEADGFKLFEAEESLLARIAGLLERQALPPEVEAPCTELLDAYKKLLRETQQLIRFSDRRERELNRLNRKLEQLTSCLAYQAEHDPLTGAYNKGATTRMIEAALSSETFGLLMFDIDFFKQVNDQHGHPSGDKLLQDLVDLVQDTLEPDDRLGRFGGEEFIILLRQPALPACRDFAERLRRRVAENWFECPQVSLRITLSFGLVMCHPGDDFATVYRLADQALYRAKHKGRNRVEVAE